MDRRAQTGARMERPAVRLAGGLLALALLYFAAAKLGLSLAFEAGQVTAVWPPTGIALGAALLFGSRVWPAIALGAFVANATTSEPLATALGIAAGNTLEALAGAWMVRRAVGAASPLASSGGVFAFVGLGALAAPMIAASAGVVSLCAGGVHPWSAAPSLWRLWWLGDATGAILVAPLLLAAAGRSRAVAPEARLAPIAGRDRLPEALALMAGLPLLCFFVFTAPPGLGRLGNALVFAIVPFVLWAALRFGPLGTSLASVLVAVVAVWGTVHGGGPFVLESPLDSLMLLQVFIAVVAVTGLLLAGADAARRRTELALQETDRHKDQFLALLSHELRNPLAPILNAAEILAARSTAEHQSRQAGDIIRRQVRHVSRLVDDLLDVSRIARGSLEVDRERCDLVRIVRETVQAHESVFAARGLQVLLELPAAVVAVDGDRTRLAQVVANLLHNAGKFCEAGGTVTVRVERLPGEARLVVADTGAGMAREVLASLFTPRRAGRLPPASRGGLGLGLLLVHAIVELHGGRVAAASRGPGLGASFTVTLPLAEAG